MFGPREISPSLRRRLGVCAALASTALALLVVRLWFLQVLQGEVLRNLSEHNRIRLRRIQATRGSIVDRNGKILVDSRASFDAVLVPEDARNLENTLETLSQFLGQSSAETQSVLAEAAGPPFEEIVVKGDLSWEEVVAIETHQLDLPGVSIRIIPRRSYPHGPVLGHVLGYVGEVSREEIMRDDRYRPGDIIGKAGLERSWEGMLRGTNGGQQVEVDAVGRELRVLHEVAESPGNTLVLTLDLDLQLAAENALGDRVGAVVALDPRNGETLAIVSRPSFDPNVFANGISASRWRELLTHPRHPLTNRAIQGQYPPGSTFKIVVAAAALEENIVNPFTAISCGGGVQFGNHFFRCWRKGGHGHMNVHDALVQSCDVFFYQVGPRIGIDTIAEYARAFGMGAPTGIGLEHEKGGIVPDTRWKRLRFGDPWYTGETLSVSIGQGYVTATPLQMAQVVATLATGRRYRPHVVAAVDSPEGDRVEEFDPEMVAELPVGKPVLAQVQEGLRDVVNSERGTGKNASLPEVVVGGKTGTSQVVKLGSKRLKSHEVPWQHRDHAWFVAYAPMDEPRIAVSVLVEHADGGGGAVAAPIAHDVLDAYFELNPVEGPQRYAQN